MTTRRRKSGALPTLAKTNPALVAALASGSCYLIVRAWLAVYYARLGTSPEEIGLTQLEVISKHMPVVLLVFTVLFVTLGAATFSVFKIDKEHETATLIAILLTTVGLVMAALMIEAHQASSGVMRGKEPHVAWPGFEPFGTSCVSATWMISESISEPYPTGTLMLLGTNNSFAVFYDPAEDATVHIPTSLVALVSRDCPEF